MWSICDQRSILVLDVLAMNRFCRKSCGMSVGNSSDWVVGVTDTILMRWGWGKWGRSCSIKRQSHGFHCCWLIISIQQQCFNSSSVGSLVTGNYDIHPCSWKGIMSPDDDGSSIPWMIEWRKKWRGSGSQTKPLSHTCCVGIRDVSIVFPK